MFALGAATGKFTDWSNLFAILFFGMRHPIKFLLLDNNGFIILVFFFFKINVRGPGQKNLINF